MLIKGVKSLHKKKLFFGKFCLTSRIFLVSVLLPASVERFFVSPMHDFYNTVWVKVAQVYFSEMGSGIMIGKVGKVGNLGKVEKVGNVGNVGNIGKVGKIGKIGKVGKEKK